MSSADRAGRAAVVIVAAGSGRRMAGVGDGKPKQFLEVAGEPILSRAIRAFFSHPRVDEVVVVVPPEQVEHPPEWLARTGVERVPGGAERSDSVYNGLGAIAGEPELVLVHDGARPFVSHALIDRVLERAPVGCAVAALPVADTLKRTDGAGRVLETVSRSGLWKAQTPQGFPLPLLRQLHQRARQEGLRTTDDAALAERYGVPVQVVNGDPMNLKITRPADLDIAELFARGRFSSGS